MSGSHVEEDFPRGGATGNVPRQPHNQSSLSQPLTITSHSWLFHQAENNNFPEKAPVMLFLLISVERASPVITTNVRICQRVLCPFSDVTALMAPDSRQEAPLESLLEGRPLPERPAASACVCRTLERGPLRKQASTLSKHRPFTGTSTLTSGGQEETLLPQTVQFACQRKTRP
uniref:Uncharacterized protein n=1 Tax=Branchiostoma floridae TaxID=7739 RepID=C3Y006_BRAFL|eukprot:XP_002610362.1 hypothetical protein BRAFLDRAFT_72436 [Branchiostoma floridae]